jgi:hypothetical protein
MVEILALQELPATAQEDDFLLSLVSDGCHTF